MSVGISSVNTMPINAIHPVNKLYVPVAPKVLKYSHFDHVSGFAAKKGQAGVSISKIQILNTLIEHLSSIKGGKIKAQKPSSPEELDTLIKNYQTQIKQAIAASENLPYNTTGGVIEVGELFSLVA